MRNSSPSISLFKAPSSAPPKPNFTPSSPSFSPKELPKPPNSIGNQARLNSPSRPTSTPSLSDFLPLDSNQNEINSSNSPSIFAKKPLPRAPSQTLHVDINSNTNISSDPNLLVVSRYAYGGNSKDDLILQEGDVIHKIEKTSEQWWIGTNFRTKIRGKFPVGHIKELSSIETVYAAKAYQPVNDFEMPLRKREPIDVLYKTKGWWFGKHCDYIGYFPINCATRTKPPEIQRGIGLDSHPVYHSHSKGANRPAPAPIPKAPSRVATVLYSFTAQHPGDLAIEQGTEITILDASGSWWKAEYNGVSGKVPANYVQLHT